MDAFVPALSNGDAEERAGQVRADSAGNCGAPIDHDDERAASALADTNTQRRRVRFRMLGQAIPSVRHNVAQSTRLPSHGCRRKRYYACTVPAIPVYAWYMRGGP